jgi:hypothetical protein
MSKMFIVRISYTDYAVSHVDALALLDIGSRMIAVKQNGYTGPYYPVKGAESGLACFDGLSLSDVEKNADELDTDKFTKATRDVSPF